MMLGLFLLSGLLLLSGCPKKPPTKAYQDAIKAIQEARNAKANDCAKGELLSAEKMLARAKKFMDDGKYDEAKIAFDAAKKLANKARDESQSNTDCLNPKPKKPPVITERQPPPPRIIGPTETPQADNRESLEAIYFDFNKEGLTADAKKTLQEHAAWLEKNTKARIEISGHCDTRGSVEYNLVLGEKRANKTRTFLVRLGISRDRISVISYGHQRPAESGSNSEAHGKNRRAEFKVNQ